MPAFNLHHYLFPGNKKSTVLSFSNYHSYQLFFCGSCIIHIVNNMDKVRVYFFQFILHPHLKKKPQ